MMRAIDPMLYIVASALILTWRGTASFYNVYQQDAPLVKPGTSFTTDALTNKWTKIATVSTTRLALPNNATVDVIHSFKVKACNYSNEP